MRISRIDEERILFDNGNEITYYHEPSCCEWNYADFKQLDDLAMAYDFNEQLVFAKVEGAGFTFGDNKRQFFVPCYSEQNGYYSDEIDVYYNSELKLTCDCEERYYW